MKNSKIQWTDHTFNPWRGCTKVSPGCTHCYAETLSKRNPKLLGEWGPGKPRVRASAKMWKEPLKWNEEATYNEIDHEAETNLGKDLGPYIRPRVFCASLADWLDDEVPIEWLADLLQLIHDTPNLDWLLLTKRPQNWERRIFAAMLHAEKSYAHESHPYREGTFCHWLESWRSGFTIPSNVWIGTTVEDQARANERIPQLLQIPARIRFLSCEPLLEFINLNRVVIKPSEAPDRGKPDVSIDSLNGWHGGADQDRSAIHWVICGGESGPNARPMHPVWALSLRDQCRVAQLPFFFKQWGGVNKAITGRLLDGREWNEFPQ